MKIGIPRALLYYKYKDLWLSFFEKLGVQVIISPVTNREILSNGLKLSMDEACLSSKIFIGHVHYLIGKCDYIFVPRVSYIGGGQELCPKFFGLADVIVNTFPDAKIMDYNFDASKRQIEAKAFLDLGLALGKSAPQILLAYNYACKCQQKEKLKLLKMQKNLLKKKGLKVLVVSHAYNTYDEYIGKPLIDYLEELDVMPIYADIVNKDDVDTKAQNISEKIYWAHNKELLAGIETYKEKVDGIIIVSTFPCGTDSLVNEMIYKKVKEKPIITILLDEQDGTAGMVTRIESFIDILKMRESKKLEEVV